MNSRIYIYSIMLDSLVIVMVQWNSEEGSTQLETCTVHLVYDCIQGVLATQGKRRYG